jgi:ABC-2 type transport system permease protein
MKTLKHEFLSVPSEARAFRRMRYRILATLFRQTIVESRLRVSLVLALTLGLWGSLFWVFLDGFAFLKSTITHPETYARTVGALFGTFFATLMVMLVFSAAIILFGSLFRSREITFLLAIPARTERVFLHKFQDAIVMGSWGFVFIASPVLIAYGVVAGAPWYYYAMLLPCLVAFVYVPAAIGAMICLFVVYRTPNSRLTILVGSCVFVLASSAWLAWLLLGSPTKALLTPDWFQELLGRLQFSEQRLLPNWWLSQALLAAAGKAWSESVLFLTLLVSNALMFRLLALSTANRIYRAAYSGLCGRAPRRKRPWAEAVDRALSRLTARLPTPMRLMIVKDLRLFRRDPLQWSQFLIFFGLLLLYFSNIRRFTYDLNYVGWVNMVSFLNVSVVGLLLSTFTTRFIFPMISLEGRRFWILGLLPMRRDAILWGKFLFASGGAIVPCSALVLLSDTMLKVSSLVLLSHQLTCLVLCLGLSGIAVGMGAYLPNLREQSPSRIAAGFGGTMCLVLSTLYILVVVLLTAMPIHFALAAHPQILTSRMDFAKYSPVEWWLTLWLIGGNLASVLLGAIVTWAPMWIGCRAFRKLEF